MITFQDDKLYGPLLPDKYETVEIDCNGQTFEAEVLDQSIIDIKMDEKLLTTITYLHLRLDLFNSEWYQFIERTN